METSCPLCESRFVLENSDNPDCPECQKKLFVYEGRLYPLAHNVSFTPDDQKVACPACYQRYDVEWRYWNLPMDCPACGKAFFVLGADLAAGEDVAEDIPLAVVPRKPSGVGRIIRSMARRLWEFADFKIMVLPFVAKWLWLLMTIGSMVLGVYLIIISICSDVGMPAAAGIVCGVIYIVAVPFVLHMVLELLLVPFKIIELLREIRDRNTPK